MVYTSLRIAIESHNDGQKQLGASNHPTVNAGIPRWITYLTAVLGLIYLLNPTGGVLELIPDIIPIVGNLDEGAAMLLIWYGLVEFFEGRKTY